MHSSRRIALIYDRFGEHMDFPPYEFKLGLSDAAGGDATLEWHEAANCEAEEARLVDQALQTADAVVCHPIGSPTSLCHLQALAEHGAPLILLDRIPEGYRGSAVLSDSRRPYRDTVRQLLQRGREPYFLGFDKPGVSSATERVEAFLEACTSAGVQQPEKRVTLLDPAGERDYQILSPEVGFWLAKGLKGDPGAGLPPLTAAIAMQDVLGWYLDAFLDTHGLQARKHVDVVYASEWPNGCLRQPERHYRILRSQYEIGRHVWMRCESLWEGQPPAVVRIAARVEEPHPPAMALSDDGRTFECVRTRVV